MRGHRESRVRSEGAGCLDFIFCAREPWEGLRQGRGVIWDLVDKDGLWLLWGGQERGAVCLSRF